MSTSIQCGICGSVLKSKTPIPAGKKLKCPKCHQVFVSKVEQPASSGSGSANPLDDFATPSGSAGTARGPGSEGSEEGTEGKKSKKSNVPLILGIGVGVLLLFCCFPGVGTAVWWFSTGKDLVSKDSPLKDLAGTKDVAGKDLSQKDSKKNPSPNEKLPASKITIGDVAEYRATKNGAPDWTRKLTVIAIDDGIAKVRYETTFSNGKSKSLDISHPLNEPFQEKQHSFPKVGTVGRIKTTQVSETEIEALRDGNPLKCSAIRFERVQPVTLDGKGEMKDVEIFVVAADLPFGGLARMRRDSLIIGGKIGITQVYDLVRYTRNGKTYEVTVP